MLDYLALEALAVVVREKSFSKAAAALFITQSAVSQRIKALEELVEQPLLIRSPTIRPTAIGQQMIAHYRQVSLLEDALKKKYIPEAYPIAPLPLAIAINTETLSTWFIKAVQPILKEGRLVLELLIEDQERTIRFLQTGRVWGCVTSVAKPPHGCISNYLGDMVYRLVAAPSFKERYFKTGVDGKALLRAPAAIYGESDYMHDNYLRQHFKSYREGRPARNYVPSPQGLVQFAVKGLAFALLPEPSIDDYLKDGRLVDLLSKKPLRLPLYWQTQELQTETTQMLSRRIVTHAQTILEQKTE